MWWNDFWPMPWMIVFGPMMMMVFVVLCFAMMWLMMRGKMRHSSRSDYAIDILKERYARGEINQAEYEERRRLLQA